MSEDADVSAALTEASKKKKRRVLLIVVVVVVVVVIVMLVCVLLYSLLAPVVSNVFDNMQEFYATGDAFMTALGEDNYSHGYALFVTDLQQEVGDAASLQRMIQDNQAQPAEWKWTAFNLSTEGGGQTVTLEGSVTYRQGREGAVTLEMVKVGGEWKLTSFNLTW